MHADVAHSLSVMVVQADGALYAAQRRPEVAFDTLRTISETGRTSLTEMRKLLGLLREGDEGWLVAPMPGAGDIPGLIEQLRNSGLAIDLRVSYGPFSQSVALMALRDLTADVVAGGGLPKGFRHLN